jgi:LacI family transcriptional regulator
MATIKDVAKEAGVGLGTVSRVLNNHPSVSKDKRKKVLTAVKKLGFVPNEAARTLKTQTRQMVALLIPTTDNPYLSKIAYYVEEELFNRGYKMMLCNNHAQVDKELSYLTMLRRNKIAGIIGITYNDIESFIQTNIPIVSIDRNIGNDIPCVAADNLKGGEMACHVLLEKGCTKLAFLGDRTSKNSEVKERERGFLNAARERGFDVLNYSNIEVQGPLHEHSEFIDGFLDQMDEVDGVFCISDLLAAAFIKRARQRGYRIPDDLKVIGFDGIQDNSFFHPVLSTIRQPVEFICKRAVDILLQKIEDASFQTGKTLIPVAFVEGETT